MLSDTLDLAVGYLESLGGSARFFLEGHAMLLQAIAVRYPDLRQPKVLLEELGISMIGIDVDALAELGGVDQGLQPIKIRPPSPIRLQQVRQTRIVQCRADLGGARGALPPNISSSTTTGYGTAYKDHPQESRQLPQTSVSGSALGTGSKVPGHCVMTFHRVSRDL